jgi:hypothetical protein
MERYGRIYHEVVSLLRRGSKTITPKLLDSEFSFRSKMSSLEIIYLDTLKKCRELEEVVKKENAEGKILFEETGKARNETTASFEAYLNAFYSLLQIIAKVTPYFYEEKELELLRKKEKHFGDNFGDLINTLKQNVKIDPKFSSYIKEKLGWYKTLGNNRKKITHERSAFLGFTKDFRPVFIDYAQEDKQTILLEDYLGQSFNDLFDFLDFYVNHFSQRLKST